MLMKDMRQDEATMIADTASVREAGKKLSRMHGACLLVLDRENHLGSVRLEDVTEARRRGMNPDDTPVAQIMHHDVYVATEDEEVGRTRRLMEAEGAQCAVVIPAPAGRLGLVPLGRLRRVPRRSRRRRRPVAGVPIS